MKITKKQREILDSVRSRQNKLKSEIGGLYIAKYSLQERIDEHMDQLKETTDELRGVMGELVEKYGHGSLDLETGEYILDEKSN